MPAAQNCVGGNCLGCDSGANAFEEEGYVGGLDGLQRA